MVTGVCVCVTGVCDQCTPLHILNHWRDYSYSKLESTMYVANLYNKKNGLIMLLMIIKHFV